MRTASFRRPPSWSEREGLSLKQAVRWTLLVALAVGAVAVGGCRDAEPPGPPPMQFDVDPPRLGPVVALPSDSLAFQPPVGWKEVATPAVPDSVVEVAPAATGGGQPGLEPLHVFMDEDTGSVLSVARLRLPGSDAFDAQVRRYAADLSGRFADDSLRQASFTNDGLHVVQFLVQPAGLVNFKLVLEGQEDDLVQFDYVVPQAEYPSLVKAVESSIGSIRRPS